MTDYRTRIYQTYASRYADASQPFDVAAATRWGKIYEHYLAGWLPEHKTAAVLDAGCGVGNLLHFFRAHGYEDLSGIDLSLQEVQLARQVVPGVEHGAIEPFLKSRLGRFDLIVGIDVIEHLKKDEVLGFLDACAGALRPGGRLILQTPNGASPWGSGVRYGDFTHETCFTPESLSWLLSLTGFAGIETRAAGPRALSVSTTLRYLAWRGISAGLSLWNVVETGTRGAAIHTRVFFASAVKQPLR